MLGLGLRRPGDGAPGTGFHRTSPKPSRGMRANVTTGSSSASAASSTSALTRAWSSSIFGSGMPPQMGEGFRNEAFEIRLNGGTLEERRPRRHEQTHGELHRVHVIHEILLLDPVEDVDVIADRRPGREGDPGGARRNPVAAKEVDGLDSVFPSVSLGELTQYVVAEGFERGDDENTAKLCRAPATGFCISASVRLWR